MSGGVWGWHKMQKKVEAAKWPKGGIKNYGMSVVMLEAMVRVEGERLR